MAIPLYTGTGGVISSTAGITVLYPVDRQVDDILILFVTTAAQAVTTPAGWTLITSATIGTAAAVTGAVALYAYWQRYASGVSQAVADSGSYTTGAIFGFRYASKESGVINVSANDPRTASASAVLPSVTTTVRDCVVIMGIGTDQDIATPQFSGSPTNANLGQLTLLMNESSINGVGGGLVVIDGEKMTAGATGTTTGTLLNSQVTANITIAIAPAPSSVKAVLS
jgi:hypothetical protein